MAGGRSLAVGGDVDVAQERRPAASEVIPVEWTPSSFETRITI